MRLLSDAKFLIKGREIKESMKHNKTWFYKRIGKKVYCDDHPQGFLECRGIIAENEFEADNVRANQERGVEFIGEES